MKKLLTTDYDNCFLSSLGLSESDQYAYYHNFILDHYQSNPDIIDGLKKAVDRAYAVWFRMANDMALRGWEIDDDGKTVHRKLNEIPLPAFDFARRIGYSGPMLTGQFYKSDFDGYKEVLNRFDMILKAWEAVKEYEAILPEEAKRKLKDLPIPSYLDIAGMEDRAATVKLLFKYTTDTKPTTNEHKDGKTDTLESLLKRKNNFCPDIELSEAISYFAALTIPQKCNGRKPFLTVEQFKLFIRRAFLQESGIKELTLDAKSRGPQSSIRKFFYNFKEKVVTNNWDKDKDIKDKYVRLLTDNFTNYDYKTIFNNFNSGNNSIAEAEPTQINELLKM